MDGLPPTLLSVDLDDAACYHAIHGLPPPNEPQRRAGLEVWLPRWLEVFDAADVRATFFVIGRDVARDLDEGGRGAQWLRQAVAEGHELANHGFAHAYDMVSWSAERQREDLVACDAALRELGAHVEGFRAPGYTHATGLLREVAALGYRYDSSSLPSPTYYAAKLTVMGWMAIRGERSSSMARGGRSFLGPRLPHRRSDVPLWELPISVTPRARIPLIGTSMLGAPARVAGVLRHAALALPHFHMELHGIDLADPDRDPISPEVVARHAELRMPWRIRYERLRELLGRRAGGVPLRDAIA